MNVSNSSNEGTDALYRQTFFPYAAAAIDRARTLGGRFVYYTTAATAVRILGNREIWMRNTSTMNDFMEVDHGLNCLTEAFRSSAGKAIDAALERCFKGVSDEIKQLFYAWIPEFRRDTFVTCVSEHTDDEDTHGRLSMWRAYGGTAGVALVLNGGVMFRQSDALAAYTSPVAYLDAQGITEQLETIATKILTNCEYVKSLGRDGVKGAIFHMLRYAAVCTKHPAFREEKEWRVVASPAMELSSLLLSNMEVIRDVPQTVLKIKLVDHPERGLYGLTPAELIDRVLIGPCAYSQVIQRALQQVLKEAGVPDPETKVYNTGIPLRVNQR